MLFYISLYITVSYGTDIRQCWLVAVPFEFKKKQFFLLYFYFIYYMQCYNSVFCQSFCICMLFFYHFLSRKLKNLT